MIIELHVVQNVAPANLNRDDTGAPKEAVFGGYRRARVSSQSWKRAVRMSLADTLEIRQLAWRTKRLADEVAKELVTRSRPAATAAAAARRVMAIAIEELGKKGSVDKEGKTAVLWFVSRQSPVVLADLCDEHWDELLVEKEMEGTRDHVRDVVKRDVLKARAVDIALFGRMLTDAPEGGTVDAAVQMAHAISTHEVVGEFDYFTAVDDLLPSEESGAGMLGTVEFNSACFYRYACLDTDQLSRNLEGDDFLTRRAVAAFADAFVTVMPTGKQNSFAAHNPPEAVLVVVRDRGAWNLANAFADPVDPRAGAASLVELSCRRLASHWAELVGMYGDPARLVGLSATASVSSAFAALDGALRAPLREVIRAAVELAATAE